MLYLAATLHTLGIRLVDHVHTKLTTQPERGSETIEKVVWAVAVIAIAGIVVAVIKTYVTNESAKIH